VWEVADRIAASWRGSKHGQEKERKEGIFKTKNEVDAFILSSLAGNS